MNAFIRFFYKTALITLLVIIGVLAIGGAYYHFENEVVGKQEVLNTTLNYVAFFAYIFGGSLIGLACCYTLESISNLMD